MYKIRKTKTGAACSVHYSMDGRFGRVRAGRLPRSASRLAVHQYNRRLARRKCTELLNANFLPGDGHLVLNYWKTKKPSPERAMQLWDVFTKAVRRACAKAGVPWRYMHALGCGERGAMHHHLVVNREVISIVSRLWHRRHGPSPTITLLYDWQNYQGLAWYFCGQEKGENPDDAKAWSIYGKGYSTSRNLERPLPETTCVDAKAWEKYPQPDDGYVIDERSLDVGESPVTGKGYLYYIQVQLPAPPHGLSAARREEWAERQRAKNGALVKWRLDRMYADMAQRALEWVENAP